MPRAASRARALDRSSACTSAAAAVCRSGRDGARRRRRLSNRAPSAPCVFSSIRRRAGERRGKSRAGKIASICAVCGVIHSPRRRALSSCRRGLRTSAHLMSGRLSSPARPRPGRARRRARRRTSSRSSSARAPGRAAARARRRRGRRRRRPGSRSSLSSPATGRSRRRAARLVERRAPRRAPFMTRAPGARSRSRHGASSARA
jgi:hypothetical protein